jgi:hypothetical protein
MTTHATTTTVSATESSAETMAMTYASDQLRQVSVDK